MKPITLSIITINFNNKEGLRKTVDSVIAQSFKDYEFLIIDGGSTDGSKDIITMSASDLSYWCSERDNGVYAAMNKGIKVANGKYLYFLNSGDTFFSNETLAQVFKTQKVDKLVIGDTAYYDNDRFLGLFKHDKIFLDWFTNFTINHQAVFFHRSVFLEHGYYDESLKIFGDHKLMFKVLIKENFRYDYVDLPICKYQTGGISAKPELEYLRDAEKKAIHAEYFDNDHWDYLQNVQEVRSANYNMQNSRLVRLALNISRKLSKLKSLFGD